MSLVVMRKATFRDTQLGFTLLELLTVVLIVGVLAAISAPVWARFLATQRATSVQGHLRQNIQQAQLKSQQNNIAWQFSVRKKDGVIQAMSHPVTAAPSTSDWTSLDKSIQLDEETTFLKSGDVYYVRFDERGNVRDSRLGRVTVSSMWFPDIKRCVIVSTLIGATRTAKEQSDPDPHYSLKNRYCY